MNKTPTPLFVFLLPRSGSTLFQRILAAHQEIATASESHILLPYLYSLRSNGVYSEYNHKTTARGIEIFCQELPNGVDDYLSEIRTFVLRLYTKAAKSDVKYFVDKAGAYHLIAEDIIRLFPEGKFIFLWRNPLSIISSLMKSWNNSRWNIYLHDIRLFQGLPQLVAAYEKYANQACAIRYEDLITNPEEELERIFNYLELSFDPEVIFRFADIQLYTGDVGGMKQYKTLSKEPLKKWEKVLGNPIRKAWCRRYLQYIGKERLAVMGYDIDQLIAELNAIPFNLRFLSSDLLRIPYGVAFRTLEGRILKHKLKMLLAGQRVYLHR